MSTQQLKLWQGPFGDFYHERNKITDQDIVCRTFFWTNVIKTIYMDSGNKITSVLEVGAGLGQNLIAFDKISKSLSMPIKLYAVEPNEKARLRLQENVNTAEILHDTPKEPIVDLVFTYGVMIHVHPAHLRDLQQRMYNASNRYVGCCEYFAPEPRPLVYRGEKDALWLNDYGKEFLDNFPLRNMFHYFNWKPATGLDNTTCWFFEKKDRMQ